VTEEFRARPGLWAHLCTALVCALTVCLSPFSLAAQERVKEAASAPATACIPRNAITASIKSVSDGRTLTLADGREVRLPAIEVEDAAQAALSKLTIGRELILSPLAPPTDRYSRLNMRAFIAIDGRQQSIEAGLVALGLAFASPRADDGACMTLLLQTERSARTNKLGIWSEDARKKMRAENPAALTAVQGKFAAVEGKVISVRESGGTIYLNFGRRWSEDFTVTILKRNERKFADAGVEPKRLEGRAVRVRGFIEERGGPWIEAAIPQQIEIAE
jgi:endonuclease YncB( thermonuclease family)